MKNVFITLINRIFHFLKANMAISVLFVLIMPIFYSILFAHPLLDDYSWPYVLEQEKSFWGAQIFFYNNVNGRILSSFISTLFMNKVMFFLAYKITLFVYFIISFYLFYFIISKTVSGIKKNKFSVVCIVFFTLLLICPELSTQFYWLTGIIVYQTTFLLGLVFIFLVLLLNKKIENKYNTGIKIKVLFIFIIFIIPLFCEMGFFICFPILILLLIKSLKSKKSHLYFLFLAIIALFISFVINYYALGSSTKVVQYSASFNNHDILLSLKMTLKLFGELLISKIFIFYFVCNILILLFLLRNKMKALPLLNINPQIFIYLILFTIFSFYFIFYYSLGYQIPKRLQNLLFSVVELYTLLFILNLTNNMRISNLINHPKFKIVYLFFIAAFLSILIFPSNARLLYGDLLHGRSQEYNVKMIERYSITRQCDQKVCYVDKIKNRPLSIMYWDLEADSISGNSFFNKEYALFFGKNMVLAK